MSNPQQGPPYPPPYSNNPPAGYYQPAPQGYPPGSNAYVVTGPYPGQPPQQATVIQPASTTIVVTGTGNCPRCNVGHLVESFTFAGVCLAIWFFPIGIICCLAMTRKVCNRCGFHAG